MTVHEFRALREREARAIVTDLHANPSLRALAWRVLSGMARHPEATVIVAPSLRRIGGRPELVVVDGGSAA